MARRLGSLQPCRISCQIYTKGVHVQLFTHPLVIEHQQFEQNVNRHEPEINQVKNLFDRIPNKTHLIKTLLQWVGDNIQTLTERNLLEDLDIAALVLLGNLYIIAVPGSDFSLIIILSEVWLSDAHAVRDRSLEVLSQLGQEEMRHQPPETSPDLE